MVIGKTQYYIFQEMLISHLLSLLQQNRITENFIKSVPKILQEVDFSKITNPIYNFQTLPLLILKNKVPQI